MPSTAAEPNGQGTAFWNFSLSLYARPGVEAACLGLQDEQGLDVNLVLLAAWAANNGRSLDEPSATRLRAVSEPYQALVMQPLREARRGLATALAATSLEAMADDHRRRLKRLELDLERLEQLALAAELPEKPDQGGENSGLAERFVANLQCLYPDRPLPEPALCAIARAMVQACRPAS